jgi:putative ABC transport system substrate-binding protein
MGKLPTIGILGASSSVWGPWTAAFIGRLRELNWVEGRTIRFEYRWDEGHPERVKANAAELIRQNVNEPILSASDSNSCAESPQLRRLAIMADADYPDSAFEAGEVQAAARTLGLEITPLEIRRTEDIAPAFETLKGQTDALYVVSDALMAASRTRIITFALSARLPTIFSYRDYVKAGGLMSYGPDVTDLFQRAADIVDKILHGTKPGDVPVEQPTKFEFVLNLTTAKALGLTIPASFLSLADDLIE